MHSTRRVSKATFERVSARGGPWLTAGGSGSGESHVPNSLSMSVCACVEHCGSFTSMYHRLSRAAPDMKAAPVVYLRLSVYGQ